MVINMFVVGFWLEKVIDFLFVLSPFMLHRVNFLIGSPTSDNSIKYAH